MPIKDSYGRWISDDGELWWDGEAWIPLGQASPGPPPPPPVISNRQYKIIALVLLGIFVLSGLAIIINQLLSLPSSQQALRQNVSITAEASFVSESSGEKIVVRILAHNFPVRFDIEAQTLITPDKSVLLPGQLLLNCNNACLISGNSISIDYVCAAVCPPGRYSLPLIICSYVSSKHCVKQEKEYLNWVGDKGKYLTGNPETILDPLDNNVQDLSYTLSFSHEPPALSQSQLYSNYNSLVSQDGHVLFVNWALVLRDCQGGLPKSNCLGDLQTSQEAARRYRSDLDKNPPPTCLIPADKELKIGLEGAIQTSPLAIIAVSNDDISAANSYHDQFLLAQSHFAKYEKLSSSAKCP